MAEHIAVRDPNRRPTHPGVILGTAIKASGFRKNEAARHLRLSSNTLEEILASRLPISPDIAVRVGELMGNGPDLWLAMQAAHDEWRPPRGD